MSAKKGFLSSRWIVPIILLVTGWNMPSYAQSNAECRFSIRGTVVEQKTLTPVPGATVYIREIGKGAVTNAEGEYVIEHVCVGKYHLCCSYIGYHSDTTLVQVGKEPLQTDFKLEESDTILKTIIVTAEKPLPPAIQPSTEIQGIELDRTRGLSLGESLKSIVGVNAIQTGPSISKPMIHGLHSNRVLILNNGVRQEGQQWGSEHAPEIDPFIAKRISVIKGAAGVRYGSDAIGGVVLVEPDELAYHPGVDGEINLVGATNSRQGVISGILQGGLTKNDNWGWRLQGTAKRAGNIRTPDYYLKNSALSELNFSSAIGYKKENFGTEFFYSQFNSQIGIFAGSHIGNLSDLKTAFQSDGPLAEYHSSFSYKIDRPFQDIRHQLFKAKSFYKGDRWGKLNVTYGFQHNYRAEYDSHIGRGSNPDSPELRFKIQTHTADVVWEHPVIRRFWQGSVGISTIYQFNDLLGRYLIPNYRNKGVGLFVLERYVREKWEAEAGLRYDFRFLSIDVSRLREPAFSDRSFSNVSGTTGILYKLSPAMSLRANAGMGWRPPAVNELFSDGVHHGEAVYEKGNNALEPEIAYNLILGMAYKTGKVQAEVNGYQYIFTNYIYREPTYPPVLTIRGAFPSFQYNQADALLSGIDAAIGYQLIPQLTLKSKASVIRAKHRWSKEYFPLMPADRLENAVQYKVNHWQKISDIVLSFSSLHVARQTRISSAEQEAQTESFYPLPPKGYSIFNAEASFSVPSWRGLNVGVTVNNLFNTRYRDYLNRFRYFTDEMGRNIIVRIKFTF